MAVIRILMDVALLAFQKKTSGICLNFEEKIF
jgi:hypothetical protein